MAKVFDIKDMGEASHILDMRIHRDRSKKMLHLSQEEYTDKVLQCFNMGRGKALMTPLPSYVKLSNQDCPLFDEEKAEMDKMPYVSTCGSSMYAMIATLSDIAFAVGVVDAIVYLVDAADQERFVESKNELDALLLDHSLSHVPFLILGNKIDLPTAASEDELRYYLGLSSYTTGKGKVNLDDTSIRPIEVFMCSIARKMGYGKGFEWLCQYIA
ncbi:hypothetical protein L7F22_035438 [Adiantum nelumboides]|nr:hypothetical protein [Adiantum nelumboides]